MDETALRLEQVWLDVQTTEQLVQLQARRHVAVLAVGLTSGAGALAAGLTGLSSPGPSITIAGASVALVLLQVRALGRLARLLLEGQEQGRSAIERLMPGEVKHGVDASRQDGP